MKRNHKKLDRFVDQLLKKFEVPGLALGIFESGALTCWRCRGN